MSIYLLVATLICLRPCDTLAADRLIDEEPTDLITLKDGQVLIVEPLELPQRRLPENRTTGSLRVRLVNDPNNEYEVGWGSIRSVELFEQRILAEAKQYSDDDKFDEAFDNFAFLLENYPDTEGIDRTVQEFLKREARWAFGQNQYDRALMILLEMSERDPSESTIAASLDRVGDRLIRQYLEGGKLDRARGVISLLETKFPGREFRNLEGHRQKIIQQANAELERARRHADASEFREANLAIQAAEAIWPSLPGAAELARQIRQAYPQIIVGVTSPGPEQPTTRLDDIASRRTRRLLMRTLLEIVDYGSEGGVYRCPLGEMSQDVSGNQLTIRLFNDIHWSSGAGTLTGHDVARELLRLADPDDPSYDRDWANMLGGVSVNDVYEVRIDLALAHVRPEGLLKKGVDGTAGFADRATSGPYYVADRTEREQTYRLNKDYFAHRETQPKEIVEVLFPNVDVAVGALRRGDIDVLDRVPPRSLKVLRSDVNIDVQPYALPTVHVLLPNLLKPRMKIGQLRRAIVYGINRSAVLDQLILAGDPVSGIKPVSGPFPVGTGLNDPIGFASNSQLVPRPYDPPLALLYSQVAASLPSSKTAADAATDAGSEEPEAEAAELPPLVLAHPADVVARTACEAFQYQLDIVGVPVVLKELEPGDLANDDLDYDLLYAELAMWEPIVDARRLLGLNGLTGGCSPYMSLALRKLEDARNWGEVRTRMREVHQIAYDDVAVIPLWQTVNFFAYRPARITGIGDRPVVLYQDIEEWQVNSTEQQP